jgi:hypothetical protein
MTKKYQYTNDMGEPKTLMVTQKGETYNFSIWSNRTGDFCGGGQMTKEQLDEFLSHYHIK